MRHFLLLVGTLVTSALYGQTYTIVDTLQTKEQEQLYTNFINENNQLLIQDFSSLQLKDKKRINQIVKGRTSMVEDMIKQRKIMNFPSAKNYFESILQEVISKNKLSIRKPTVWVSRSATPNAVSYSNNWFTTNLAILNHLENEEQLKYIMSHELAHQILQHLKKELAFKDTYMASEDFLAKKKIANKSKQTEYQNKIELYKEFEYLNKKLSRQHELEADSLALVLFGNVSKNTRQAYHALSKLDTLDYQEFHVLKPEDLKSYFNTDNAPFKDSWLPQQQNQYYYKSSKTNALGINKDSISTHPAYDIRLKSIEKHTSGTADNLVTDSEDFTKLKQAAVYENAVSYILNKYYGEGLYYTVQMLKKKPNDALLNKYAALFINRIANARRKHTFNRHVDKPNQASQLPTYFTFLTILDNMTLSDLEKLEKRYQTKP